MNKIWTIKELIQWTTDYFKDKNIDSPRLTAELLLGKTLNKTRLYLYTNYSQPLLKEELSIFKSFIKRRVAGEPTAYILGEKEFWSLKFKVNRDVLIPRPDTEILIETIIQFTKKKDNIKILEIGTGSGNISISIAKESHNIQIFSIDISFNALKVAKENIIFHNELNKICLINGDTIYPIKNKRYFDIVVSNPPYIKQNDLKNLQVEIKNFEPAIALNGGKDGLIFYKKITEQAKNVLKNQGLLFFEIGKKEQVEEIKKIMLDFGFQNIVTVNDYANLPRVIYGTFYLHSK